MSARLVRLGLRLLRLLALLVLVAAGTLALIRYAPGYYADARELGTESGAIRAELEAQRSADGSVLALVRRTASGIVHGSLGTSRHFHVPVGELIRPRLWVTGRILLVSLATAWSLAFAIAVLLSAGRSASLRGVIAIISAALLAVPIGALATVFLLTNVGGPVLALSLLLAARDFKFAYQLFSKQWRASHMLCARAQGLGPGRLILVHLVRPVLPELASLLTMSFIAALSFSVPAEVIFDIPGIGQLAWTAAMNRDAPLLLAITLIMGTAVGSAGLLGEPALVAGSAPEMA